MYVFMRLLCCVLLCSTAVPALAVKAAPKAAPKAAQKSAAIVIDYRKEPALCDAMLWHGIGKDGRELAKLQFPADAETDLATAAEVEVNHFSSIRSRNHFELDGEEEEGVVFGLHQRSRRDFSDTYFFGGDASLDAVWQEVPTYRFYRKNVTVFPDSFSNTDHTCNDLACDARFMIRQAGNKQKPFSYRIRTMQATPFVWQQTTYFLLTTVDAGERHLASVVLPRKTRVADEICLFRQESGEMIELVAH